MITKCCELVINRIIRMGPGFLRHGV